MTNLPDKDSLQRQLAEARENLRLIEEREAEFPLSTDIPLLLVKEKRRLLTRIDELEQQLAAQPPPPADSGPTKSKYSWIPNVLKAARDPIWQMIGVLVAVVGLGWAVYTFYIGPSSSTPTPTFTPTTTVLVVTNTPTSDPSTTPTNTPVAPTFTAIPASPATETPTATSTSIPTHTPTAMPTSTPTYTPTPDLTKGLIAYYPFEGDAKDKSGNGNDGDVQGATLTVDRKGNANSAYSFNGKDNYISIPNKAMLDMPNVKTVCAWFQLSDTNKANVVVSKYREDNWYESGYSIMAYKKTLRLLVKNDSGPVNSKSAFEIIKPYSSLTAKDWVFACLVISDKKAKEYVNGNYIGSSQDISGSLSGNSCKLLIGDAYSKLGEPDPDNYFSGVIDEVRIYNRVLTDLEIKILASY